VPGPIMIMGIFGLVGKRKVDLRTCIGTRYRPSPPRYLSRGPPIQYVGERASAVCLLESDSHPHDGDPQVRPRSVVVDQSARRADLAPMVVLQPPSRGQPRQPRLVHLTRSIPRTLRSSYWYHLARGLRTDYLHHDNGPCLRQGSTGTALRHRERRQLVAPRVRSPVPRHEPDREGPVEYLIRIPKCWTPDKVGTRAGHITIPCPSYTRMVSA
jgi:hypothetical protein